MMKILHSADWHLGAYAGPQCDDPIKRMENTMKCLDHLVKTAKQEKPDVILVCGDIFHTARVWADRSNVELRAAAEYVRELAWIAPVAMLYGTPNHDSMEQFRSLICMCEGYDITFCPYPALYNIQTKSGPLQVAGLPGFDKGHFRAQLPGLSAEEESKVFTSQLSQIVAGLSAQLEPGIPSVLMAHHTVTGCELDNGQSSIFLQNEVLLETGAIDNSNFDLVCLGHIHTGGAVPICRKPVYYAGSIDAFTFNDEGHKKGFWIHYIDEPGLASKWFETPAREFYTIKLECSDIENIMTISKPFESIVGDYVKDKVVRVLYTCDEATGKALDKKKLERDLYAAGAYYVAEIRPEKITSTVNRECMTEKLTVNECLVRYLKEKGKPDEEISATLEDASNIIAEASANMPAGSQTGVFLPVEISVRNYRSYAEETLSFEDIYFAMVNGKNGSGKSSLFMDAIVDCLYEQPREGELTGWIRSGEKSGSISFKFKLGDDFYRVTRTRQKSGKATLNLSKIVDFDVAMEPIYDDISCEKMVDTQKKIIDLLGMDADTFRSCVLIMQDQYGRFMEAKPEDRMSVLASLLGLRMYEQLEKIAKEELRLANREVKETQIAIRDLEEEVSQEVELQEELQDAQSFVVDNKEEIAALRTKRDEDRDKVEETRRAVQEQGELREQIKNQQTLYDAILEDIKVSEGKLDVTREFLAEEKEIQKKYAEFQTAREKIGMFDGFAGLLKEKKSQRQKLQKEIEDARKSRKTIEDEIEKLNKGLELYDAVSAGMAGLPEMEKKFEEAEKKAIQWKEFQNILKNCESDKKFIADLVSKCQKQQEYLNNSGCIDVEKANCKFLQAAKEDVEKIKSYETKLEKTNKLIENTQDAMLILGYSISEHEQLKKQLKDLQNKKEILISLNGKKQAVKIYKERLNSLPDVEKLQEDLGELEKVIATLEADYQEAEKLKSQLDNLKGYEEKWQQLPAARQFEELTEKRIAELKAKAEEEFKKLQELQQKQKDLSSLTEQLEKLADSLVLTDSIISAREERLQEHSQKVGILKEKLWTIEQKKAELGRLEEKMKELTTKASRLEILVEAFSQEGIPHQIIRDIIPELEASANEILSQMTGGKMRLEFRTERTLKSNKAKEVVTLDIVIIDADNGELPYLSRSGGQKVRAALAVSFALAMVKALRVGLQLGMMFVDEPPFLDAEGVEAYCMALESIHQKYPEMRILAISHDENMKAQFPQQITVEITENGSKVRFN